MKKRFLPALFVAGALAAVATGSWAQMTKSTCLNVGPRAAEPVGDREGHTITVSEAVCTMEGGLFDGAVMTQHSVWEGDKGLFTIISADGVARGPGGIMVYRLSAGTQNLTMQDGKPTGWTSSGKGTYPVAGGNMAAVAGKSFSWTARSTGPRSYVIESKVD